MKKLILLTFFLVSCAQAPEEIAPAADSPEMLIADSIDVSSTSPDSIMEKANTLISSTENAEKKVSEIKTLKHENVVLKKELIETKSELNQIKAALADTTEGAPTKRMGFIKRVITSIKKDTLK